MKKITTFSGAIYMLQDDGRTITGGSKGLKDGHLLTEPSIGGSMMISAPERASKNPHFEFPGVTTSYIVSIEDYAPSVWDRAALAFEMFLDAWRSR